MKLGPLELRSPVLPAAGTYGRELVPFANPEKLGAVVTRSITLHPNPGAPPPRLIETSGGLLSFIGMENSGVQAFLKDEFSFWRQFKVPLIVNIAGKSGEELAGLCKALSGHSGIDAVELNLGPLVESKTFAEEARNHIRAVKENLSLPLIAKIPPRQDMAAAARLCEKAGADILSLVCGFPGVSVDRRRSLPLGNGWGWLTGPAIKPLALKLVAEASRAVKVPVVGMGGIFSAQDASDFLQAGAAAVAVGTASLVNPRALVEIAEGVKTSATRS